MFFNFSSLGTNSARPVLREFFNFSTPFFGGSISFGAKFLTYSERARRVLPYGINFSSLGPNPARPELREFFNSIFPGGAFRLGPNF